MKKYPIILFFILGFLSFSKADPIPQQQGRINDLTNTLTTSQIQYLESILAKFEDSTSNQIVVLIVYTTGEQTIEDYSMKVAESWKIGQEGKDNGVILLIAKNDRKVRIEVGYGLEANLTDAKAYSIISNFIVPQFKNGNFYAGIYYGISEIINTITIADFVSKVTIKNNTYTSRVKKKSIVERNPSLIAIIIILSVFLPFGMLFFINRKFIYKLIASLILLSLCLLGAYCFGDIFYLFAFGMPSFIFILMTLIKFKGSGSGYTNYNNNSSSSYKYSSNNYSSNNSSSSYSSYSGGGGSFGGGGASGSW